MEFCLFRNEKYELFLFPVNSTGTFHVKHLFIYFSVMWMSSFCWYTFLLIGFCVVDSLSVLSIFPSHSLDCMFPSMTLFYFNEGHLMNYFFNGLYSWLLISLTWNYLDIFHQICPLSLLRVSTLIMLSFTLTKISFKSPLKKLL